MVVSRNRYGNVQPWDQSRVKLATPIAGSDYVNASPIVLKSRTSLTRGGTIDKGDTTAYNETKYIATQGPKEGQFVQFWHMVMQETAGDVGVIVMLTQCYEANKEKCAQYFPVDAENPSIYLPLNEERGKAGKLLHCAPFELTDAPIQHKSSLRKIKSPSFHRHTIRQ